MPPIEGADRDSGEDTVEFELTPAEQLELSRVADIALRSPEMTGGKPSYDSFVCARTHRADLVGTITFAMLICGIATATGWHALMRVPATHAFATSSVTLPALIAHAKPMPGVVQVVNPFDATELFEFPAETDETDARNAIAELLLERARERHQQGLDLRRAGSHHLRPAAAVKPSDVFVTKLLVSANRFGEGPGSRDVDGMVE